MAEAQLDDLEQYGRRENLEIHGVPLKRYKNTNEIVTSVVSSLNVRLDDNQISTSHRLTGSYKKFQGNQVTEQPPPNTVRFANRDKRNEIYEKRKLLKLNYKTEPMSHNSSPNIAIQKNLTPLRKSIYKAANQAKAALNFIFACTSQRKFFLRQDTDTKIYKISSFHDLTKLGYFVAGEMVKKYLGFSGVGLLLFSFDYNQSLVSLATHSQSRLNSFQTVKTLFCIALPGHLDFTSFLGCALFFAGDWP